MIARVLLGMRDVWKDMQPDVALVHEDTTTGTAPTLLSKQNLLKEKC